MIDEAAERMCQFNDQEIRRKGKLLMTKVGRRWEWRARAAGRHTLSITKRANEK